MAPRPLRQWHPKLVVTPPPTIAHYNGTQNWSSPSPLTKAHCNGTLQWHHVHSANGTQSWSSPPPPWQGKTGSISRFPLNSFFKPDVETKAREVWMQWTGRGLSQAVQSQSQIVVVSLDIQYTITRPDLLHGSPIHLSLANWNKMSLASHSHVRSWTIAPHPLHSQTSAYSEKIQ